MKVLCFLTAQSSFILLLLLLLLFVHNNYNKNPTTKCFEQYRIPSGFYNKCKYIFCVFVIFLLQCGSYYSCLVFVDGDVVGIYIPVHCCFDLFNVLLYLRFVWYCLVIRCWSWVVWSGITYLTQTTTHLTTYTA